MNEYRRKLIAYIDFLKRRGTGHTWCDEHPHFRHFEKNELGEILDRAFTPTPTEHPDTGRLRAIGRALYGMDRRELERWLDNVEIAQTGEVYSYDLDSLRSAIDALPEVDRG